MTKLAEYRKGVVAVLGALVTIATVALTQGDVIPDSAEKWVVLFVASVTALGVVQVPNAPRHRAQT